MSMATASFADYYHNEYLFTSADDNFPDFDHSKNNKVLIYPRLGFLSSVVLEPLFDEFGSSAMVTKQNLKFRAYTTLSALITFIDWNSEKDIVKAIYEAIFFNIEPSEFMISGSVSSSVLDKLAVKASKTFYKACNIAKYYDDKKKRDKWQRSFSNSLDRSIALSRKAHLNLDINKVALFGIKTIRQNVQMNNLPQRAFKADYFRALYELARCVENRIHLAIKKTGASFARE